MKKSLQDRMNDMKPYFRGIEMYNEALMVKVVLPNNWKAYPSKDNRIKVTEGDNSLIYYYADSKDTTYEEIFDLIEETIKANNDIVLKLRLLKDKVSELRELFSYLPYEELQTLKFVTDGTKKDKPKRKYTKKVKEDNKLKEKPIEVIEGVNLEDIKIEESKDQ